MAGILLVFAVVKIIVISAAFLTGSNICHEAKGGVDETNQWNSQEEPGIDKNSGVICWREDREG